MKWLLLFLCPICVIAQTLKPGVYRDLKPDKPLVLDTGSFTFINLEMENLGKGIWLDGRKAGKIEMVNCTFSGKGMGIGLATSHHLKVEKCVFSLLERGIWIYHKPRKKGKNKVKMPDINLVTSITSNTFQKLNAGIELEAVENNALTVRGNSFTDVGIGVWLHSGDENVTPAISLNFTCNQFKLSCMENYPSIGPAVTSTSHPCYTEFTNGPGRVGLFVGENVEMADDIGGNTSSNPPAGNVWPVGNKSQAEIELSSYELTGWVHPPSFTAVVNESEEGWTYFHFGNEFFNSIDNSSTGNALFPSSQRFARSSTSQEIPPALAGQVDLVCDDVFGSIVFPLLPRPTTGNGLTAKTGMIQVEEAVLGQNIPNPSNHTSTIPFYLPLSVKRARLELFELGTGRVLKGFDVLQMGRGAIEFETRSLAAGIFGYRLLVDDKPAAYRKMVVAH